MAQNIDIPDFQTPKLITNICTLFYFHKEYFSLIINGGKFYDTYITYKGECISLSDDKLSASVIDECKGTIYGNFIVDSLSDAIFEWNLKVKTIRESPIYVDGTSYVQIGIHGGPECVLLDPSNIPDRCCLAIGRWTIRSYQDQYNALGYHELDIFT